MAFIPIVSKNGTTAITANSVFLDVSGDKIQYTAGKNQELWLFNTGGSNVTVTIDGDAGTTTVIPATAGTTLDVAPGLPINIPPYSFAYLVLDKASEFLKGNVAITASIGAVVKAVITTPF